MQGSGGVDWYIRVAAAFGHGAEVVGRPDSYSEDCLYLNVWSPKPGSDSELPVMVYVHGGSNSGGWSYEPNYLGTQLAGRGVIVVTLAYRLGPFGFFSHPSLKENDDDVVTNFALLDIRAAFSWIKENIRAFGGDPDNITAFGESAGAIDIVDLLAQDAAAGRASDSLFQRLISQSLGGSLTGRKTLTDEQEMGRLQAAHMLGVEEVSAQTLRAVPAGSVLEAGASLPPDYYHEAVIDSSFRYRQPWEIFSEASLQGIEMLIGTNADEWLMYTPPSADRQDLDQWIRKNAPEQRGALLAALGDEPDMRRALDRLGTARDMLCPSHGLAEQVIRNGGRAWVYYFSRQRNGPGGERLGAYHGTELPYVFDTHDTWLPVDQTDRRLTDAVMDYWVQFARSGDPNQSGREHWPEFSRTEASIMELGDRVGLMPDFDHRLCEVLGPAAEESGGEQK